MKKIVAQGKYVDGKGGSTPYMEFVLKDSTQGFFSGKVKILITGTEFYYHIVKAFGIENLPEKNLKNMEIEIILKK